MNKFEIKIVSPSKRRLSSLTPLSNYHHDTVKSKQAKVDLQRFLNKVVNNGLVKKAKNESIISLDSNNSSIFNNQFDSLSIFKHEQEQLYTLSSLTIKNKHDYDDFCSLMFFEKTRRKSSYISTLTRKRESIKEENSDNYDDYQDIKFIDSRSISIKHKSDDDIITEVKEEFQPEWKKYLKINKNSNLPPLSYSLSTLVS